MKNKEEKAKRKYKTYRNISHIIHDKDKSWRVPTSVKRLGHKSEPYYKTEEEMLLYKKYTYESLSPDEKKIYDGKSKKQ
tara:strand:+ start:1435 stop:1671 length:237 start_codon:yes stop_codon:yes gene_type:complete